MADFKSVGFDNIDDTISEVKKDIIDFTEGRLRWGSTFRIANIIAELQSGKTLFLKGIAQNLFPDYRLFYTISYALNELNEQFKNDMRPHGNIVTFKIRATKNEKHYSNLLREISNLVEENKKQVLVLGVDESEAGINEGSLLNKLIIRIGKDLPNTRIYLITTGATPASLRHIEDDPKIMVDIKNFRMYPGDGYVGLSELRDQGCIYDTSHFVESEILQPHDEVVDKLDSQLNKHKSGLYILRTSNRKTSTAANWRQFFEKKYKNQIMARKMKIIECHTENESQITDSLIEAEKESFFKNTLLIVVGSLTAGYRLYETPAYKSYLRFGYDASGKDMSAVQGIPGRMCGYYKHENPIIFMRESAIDEYERVLDIENSYVNVSKTASTTLRGGSVRLVNKAFTPCEVIDDFDITKQIDSNKANELILNDLGYTNKSDEPNYKKARYVSSAASYFSSSWNNSNEEAPNYNVISNTYGGVKDYTVLIDREKKIARIVKKTGDKTMIQVEYEASKEVNDSLWDSEDFKK